MNALLEQINAAARVFVEFALPMLIQSGLLIVVLLLADMLLRKKVKAVFRYWIWMLVLVKLVLPASLSSPLSLGYLFGEKLTYQDLARTTSALESAEPAPAEISPGISPIYIKPNSFIQPAVPVIPGVEQVATEPVSRPAVSVPATPLSWQGIVFLVWLAVVIAMGLLLLQRVLFVRGLVAQAKKASRLMNNELACCCASMKIKRKVGLKVSPNATTPSVCGLIRPVILVPWNLVSTLGTSRLRTVLMHELAHIKRADLWVNLAQTILQIIYFYNPLLWLANCMIRRIREQAVDEAVLVAMGAKAQKYPQTLVDVAKLAFKRPALSLRLIGVVESKSALAGRIKHILGRPMPKSAKLGIVGVLAVIITAAILLPMARAREPAFAGQGGPLDIRLTGVRPDGSDDIYDGNGNKIAENTFANIAKEWGEDQQHRTFIFELPKTEEPILFPPFLKIKPTGAKRGFLGGQHPLLYYSAGKLMYSVAVDFPRTYKKVIERRIRQVDLTLRYYYGQRGAADFVFTGPFTAGQAFKAEGDADCELTATKDRLDFSNEPAAFFSISSKTRFDPDSVLVYDTSGRRYLPASRGGRSSSYGSNYRFCVAGLTLNSIAYVTVGEKPYEAAFKNVVVSYPDRPVPERLEFLDEMCKRLDLTGLSPDQLNEYTFENPADAIKVIDIVRGQMYVLRVFRAIMYSKPRLELSNLDSQTQQKLRSAAARWAKAGHPDVRAMGIRLGLVGGWPEFMDLALEWLEQDVIVYDMLGRAYRGLEERAKGKIASEVQSYPTALNSEQAERFKKVILRTESPRLGMRLFRLFWRADEDLIYRLCWDLVQDDRPWIWWPAMRWLFNRCNEKLRPFEDLPEKMQRRLILIHEARGGSSRLFKVSSGGKDYDTVAKEAYSMLPAMFTARLARMNSRTCSEVHQVMAKHPDREIATKAMTDFLREISAGPNPKLWVGDAYYFGTCCSTAYQIARHINSLYDVDINNLGKYGTTDKHDAIPHSVSRLKQLIVDTLQWYDGRSGADHESGIATEVGTVNKAEKQDASLEHFIGKFAMAQNPDTAVFEITKEDGVFNFSYLSGLKFEMAMFLKGIEGRKFEMKKDGDNLKFGHPRYRFRVRYDASEDRYTLDKLGMRGDVRDAVTLQLAEFVNISAKKPGVKADVHVGIEGTGKDTNNETQSLSFGPWNSRTINDDSVGTNWFIDLDTGNVYTPPENLNPNRSPDEMMAWARKLGIDASGVQASEGKLTGFELQAVILDVDSWKKVTPEILRSALQKTDSRVIISHQDRPIVQIGGKGKFRSAIYGFKTREGGIGLLQIAGVWKKPDRVSFSYKMLESPYSVQSAGLFETEWMSNWKGNDERKAIVLAYLPLEQRTAAGRVAILAESVKASVTELASDTSIPLYARSDAWVEGLEVTFADLRVHKLVKYAMSSEQARKEVIEHIVPVIHNYALDHDPPIVLGDESCTKGWRSGYDKLLTILAVLNYLDEFPLLIKCFELHQAEINNPVDIARMERRDWMPLDYGHNTYFRVFFESALRHYGHHEEIPPAAQELVREFVAKRNKVSRIVYKCGGRSLFIYDLHNGYGDPVRYGLRFKKAMQDAGLWKGSALTASEVESKKTDVKVEAKGGGLTVFESYFPDDAGAGRKLDQWWENKGRNPLNDEEFFELFRKGLRRSTVKYKGNFLMQHLGGGYIRHKDPDDQRAIDMVYHASFSPEYKYYAVYSGLSVANPKSEKVLKRLVDLAMEYHQLGRILWGVKQSEQEVQFMASLEPYLRASDLQNRERADKVAKALRGEIDAGKLEREWSRKQKTERTIREFGDELPKIKKTFLSGTSEDRLKAINFIKRNAITLTFDQSFIRALDACSQDSDANVRAGAANFLGYNYVWGKDTEPKEVIEILLRLSKDENRQVRYETVYTGLSVANEKDANIIKRLIELALTDHENNLYDRIVWGLRGPVRSDRKLVEQVFAGQLDEVKSDLHQAASLYFLYKELFDTEPPSAWDLEDAASHYSSEVFGINFSPQEPFRPENKDTLWAEFYDNLPDNIEVQRFPVDVSRKLAIWVKVQGQDARNTVMKMIENNPRLRAGRAIPLGPQMQLYFEELQRIKSGPNSNFSHRSKEPSKDKTAEQVEVKGAVSVSGESEAKTSAALTSQQGSVSGTVRFHGTDAPASGVVVQTISKWFDTVQTRTDQQGSYTLAGIRPEAIFHVSAENEQKELFMIDMPAAVLKPGEARKGVDLKLYQGRKGSISGKVVGRRVFYKKPGRLGRNVLPEHFERRQDSPLPGVKIFLKKDKKTVDETITDEEGRYKFEGLRADGYVIQVEQPAGAVSETARTQPMAGPGRAEDRGSRQSRWVKLKSKQKTDIDFHFRLDWVSIAGRVTDTDGNPVSGAGVAIELCSDKMDGGEGRSGAYSKIKISYGKVRAKTDKDGRYRLDPLCPVAFVDGSHYLTEGKLYRRYEVCVQAEGYSPTKLLVPPMTEHLIKETTRLIEDHRGMFRKEGPLFADVSLPKSQGNNITDIDLVLEKEAAVMGRILDSKGNIVPGPKPKAWVRLVPEDSSDDKNEALLVQMPDRTGLDWIPLDKLGRFRIDGVPPGSYIFKVDTMKHRYPKVTNDPLAISAGQVIKDVEVVVQTEDRSEIEESAVAKSDSAAKPAKESEKTRGGISGTVLNSITGEPIAGAYVGVGDFGDSGGSNYSRHRSQGFHDKTKTDEKGRFELDGLVFTDENKELDYHPLVVTHPDFVRHDEKIKLLKNGPEPDVKVSLRPAATIDVTVVDADGNPLEGQWLIRLEALDGRRFIPPGSDPHLSSFASSIWAHMPDLRKNMGISQGFAFTELDTGRYSIEAIRFHLVDKPTPQNIWEPTVTYHGLIPSLQIQTGQAKRIQLPPQNHQTSLTITPPDYPEVLLEKLKRSTRMPLMCLISRSPGIILWDDGKIHHLEDQRLGRIDQKRFFRGFFPQDKQLTINNLPPGSYSFFSLAVYGNVAGCLIGAHADLAKGDNITVDIPWRQPTGPSMFGPNRSFDYPVKLEDRDYSISELCEIMTKITQSNPRIISDSSIENIKLRFDRSDMSIWDLLEKLYLDKGWKVEEGEEKTLIIRPTKKTNIERYAGASAEGEVNRSAEGRIEFLGLDLTDAPRTTKAADLPDLFEERPPGSKSYEIAKGVTVMYDDLDGTVYYVPEKDIFYILYGKLGSSTLTYSGPFNGDPHQILDLKIDTPIKAEVSSGVSPIAADKDGPGITFESLVCDLGQVAPGTKYICEFKFTNTGNDVLKITRVSSACACATSVPQKKMEYAPGESGTLKVTYQSAAHAGRVVKSVFVYNNASVNPVKLTIKAEIVVKVAHEPKKLNFLLNKENAGCPPIKLTSIDNQPFSITGFKSTGNSITAEFSSSVKDKSLVIQPKVDMEKLRKGLRGKIEIGLTHPESKKLTITYDTLPEFEFNPRVVYIRNAQPQKPVTKKVWIRSNYNEDVEIESTSSKKGTVKVLTQEKVRNGYQFELQITPPPPPESKRRVFTDTFSVRLKGGQVLSLTCYGIYPKEPVKTKEVSIPKTDAPDDVEGVGEKFSQFIDADLPDSVQNVKFLSGSFEAASKTWTRFDIPLSDLKNLLAKSDKLPDFPDLHKNPRIQKNMDAVSMDFNVEWWKSDELENPVCAAWIKSERAKGAPKVWVVNILNICCSQLKNNLMRVYISLYSDSPHGIPPINPDMEREIEDPKVWSKELAGALFAAVRANDNNRLKALIVDKGLLSALQGYRTDFDCTGFNKMVHCQKADRCFVIISPIRHKDGKDLGREIRFGFKLEERAWKARSLGTGSIGNYVDVLKTEGFNVFSEVEITREFPDTPPVEPVDNSALKVDVEGPGESTNRETQTLSFGPVVNCVVHAIDTEKNSFIDFDTGKYFNTPKKRWLLFDFDVQNLGHRVEWAKKTGADAAVRYSSGGTRLLGMLWSYDIAAKKVDPDNWQDLRAEQAVQYLSKATHFVEDDLGHGDIRQEPPDATHIFKTREGGVGIIQIVGFTNNPMGVKIRYKMVQKESAGKTDVQVGGLKRAT